MKYNNREGNHMQKQFSYANFIKIHIKSDLSWNHFTLQLLCVEAESNYDKVEIDFERLFSI